METNGNHGSGPIGGVDECADFFKVVGEKTRLELLSLIAKRPSCVKELVAQTGLESSHLSKHFRSMRRAGLVAYERRGQRHVYSLGPAVRGVAYLPEGTRLTVCDPTGAEHVVSLIPPRRDGTE